jgi:4-cresol dehydrogenase (hydroxylating)
MKLPPGISDSVFNSAVREFERAVGKDWVYTSAADLDLYRDAYSPFKGEEEERLASAAVAPSSVEEVQAVVRIANQYKIPIYPISTGKNLGYGGSAPNLSGSVVLDLKRMNRVLEVDEANASCLVEPGVSYFDLYRHLQANGSRLWIDTPDPGWGSLIGNALDRGGGYTAAKYRNHFDAHCGMEVVLANGEVLRTGMGALPGARTWQQYKSGFGPWIDGLFSQSNFGVVTKMGFWLMPQPDGYLAGRVEVFQYEDLIPLVDIMTNLENNGIYTGMPMLDVPLINPGLLPGESLRAPPPAEVQTLLGKPGGPAPAELEAYCKQHDVGLWGCKFQYYGPEDIVRAQWAYTMKRLSVIAGARFSEPEFYNLPLTPEQVDKVHKVTFGIPNLEMFFIGARSPTNPNPTRGHIWFSPIIPRNGREVFKAQRVFSEASRQLGLPVFPLAMATTYWERAFIFIFGFPITDDIELNRRNRAAFRELVRIGAENGWGEYRTAPAYQDAIMATYSFNNHALLRFHETVKDAIDPNGIIAPGRYGIWPKHLRGNKA